MKYGAPFMTILKYKREQGIKAYAGGCLFPSRDIAELSQTAQLL